MQEIDQTPILIGCGQITQREPTPSSALNAMDLTATAARAAAADAGPARAVLEAIDTLVVIRSFSDTSWRFASPFGGPKNPPRSIAARLELSQVRRHVYTYPGGNMPQACVNQLFSAIRQGDVGCALICGGEALATQKAAQRAGLALDWNEDPGGEPELWGVSTRGWNEIEDRHRMAGAIYTYPLFENSIRAHLKRTIAEHQRAMGELFARFAAVAKGNPLADRRQGFSAQQIAQITPDNPLIGFPYTKLMNSNAFIDQSAALILTSVGKAKALGIAQDRWIYLHGCADAHDHWFVSDRHNYHSSPAMRVVAQQTLAMAEMGMGDIDRFDLYSCFPSAVQIACQEMGLASDDPRGLTVTGGLPYFGGPGNNYVTHSIAQMMNELRAKPGSLGMVTANGNYVTKQSAGIYSTQAPDKPFAPANPADYQREIDDDKGPPVTEVANGSATVETYTVMHDRQGPSYAIVFARLNDGNRFIANTPDDPALLQQMVANDYIGKSGRVTHDTDTQRNLFVPD